MSRAINKIAALRVATIIGASALEIACATNRPPETIPANITSSLSENYREMNEKDTGRQVNASIKWCTKGSERIFEVVRVEDGIIMGHYYTQEGEYLGRGASGYSFSSPDANLPKPPINIDEYNCTVVKAFVNNSND